VLTAVFLGRDSRTAAPRQEQAFELVYRTAAVGHEHYAQLAEARLSQQGPGQHQPQAQAQYVRAYAPVEYDPLDQRAGVSSSSGTVRPGYEHAARSGYETVAVSRSQHAYDPMGGPSPYEYDHAPRPGAYETVVAVGRPGYENPGAVYGRPVANYAYDPNTRVAYEVVPSGSRQYNPASEPLVVGGRVGYDPVASHDPRGSGGYEATSTDRRYYDPRA
jgi:hypothetical protein